jgi:pescadillo protein
VKRYGPGKSLPPHLSPFVNDEQEGYVPERKQQVLLYIQQSKSGLEPRFIAGAENEDNHNEIDEALLEQRDVEELYQEGKNKFV